MECCVCMSSSVWWHQKFQMPRKCPWGGYLPWGSQRWSRICHGIEPILTWCCWGPVRRRSHVAPQTPGKRNLVFTEEILRAFSKMFTVGGKSLATIACGSRNTAFGWGTWLTGYVYSSNSAHAMPQLKNAKIHVWPIATTHTHKPSFPTTPGFRVS